MQWNGADRKDFLKDEGRKETFKRIIPLSAKMLVKSIAKYGKDEFLKKHGRRCISLQLVQKLLDLRTRIECSFVAVGTKNALDFQLASHLGYLIGTNGNENTVYYIVSNDKGFDCICDFWRVKGISVERIYHMEPEDESIVQMGISADAEITMAEIREVLDEKDMYEEVLGIFNQFKTKQAICNSMSKLYKDSKKASEVYKKLKPLLQKKMRK